MLKITATYRLVDGQNILEETTVDLEDAEAVMLAVRTVYQRKYTLATEAYTQLPLPFAERRLN